MALLKDLAPKDAQLGVALAVKFNGRLLFVLQEKRRWKKDERDMRLFVPVSGIGGAVGLDEDFLAAARRECAEETGVSPVIESAKRTVFVDYDDSVKPVEINDDIKPAVIFRRVYLNGPESWQLFCPVYLASMNGRPEPKDVPALLSLTLEQFRMLRRPQRLSAFLEAGVHLIEGPAERVPRSAFLSTFGSVEALLLIDASRVSLAALLRNK